MTKSAVDRDERDGSGYGNSCPGRCHNHQNATRAGYDALARKMELVDAW